jgi:uncharacterized membrane protein
MENGNPRSTARIAGHPVHPMLVMFPVVLFILVWVCDIAFWTGRELFWVTLGLIALAVGLITAALAAVAGLIDYFGDARIRALRAANLHLVANVVAVLIEAANLLVRLPGGPSVVVPTGLLLSTAAVLVLGFSGWMGGSLVYELGVGVNPPIDSDRVDRQGR